MPLQRRRTLALERGWLGELKGLNLALRVLTEERAEMQRLRHLPVVHLSRRTDRGAGADTPIN